MTKSPLSGGRDERKTKAQLIAELAAVRQRVDQLEAPARRGSAAEERDALQELV